MTTITLTEHHRAAVERILESAAEFRRAFGAPFSENLLAEVYVARQLGLEICMGNNAGFDAVDPKGQRYQIKNRSVKTLNVDVNNFDFDHLILVNLDEFLKPSGMWIVARAEIEGEFTSREKFRKHQITQQKLKRLAKGII
ncbi:MAG: DUF6998 domain-containing protein [Fimbriimonadaceae bacterium]